MSMNRRGFMKLLGVSGAAAAIPGLNGCATLEGGGAKGQVVVVGGGFAGATAAKYIRMWDPDIAVTLVERNPQFISCPMSNLVIGGNRQMADITRSYDTLKTRWGVKLVQGEVTAIDAASRQVRLADGTTLKFDRLIVAPGIDFMYEQFPGLSSAAAQEKVPHAWKAGAQTRLLRSQLEAMPDGGVYVLGVPKMPYRCPPGPYERICQVAHYFKAKKPKSKIIVLDANPDIVSKKGLFMAAWNDFYKGMIDYRTQVEITDVDPGAMTVKTTFESVKGSVLNIVPQQKAGPIAIKAGLANAGNRWCEVDFLSYESKVAKNVHVLGDAIAASPGMPKSGHMANQHGKICAAAVVALMNGQPVNPEPLIANTCYSFVSDDEAMHVAAVYAYDGEKKTMAPVKGAGGVSKARSALEGQYAWAWGQNIWADTLG